MKNAIFLVLIIAAFLVGFAVNSLMPKQKIDAMSEIKKVNRQLDEQLIRKTEASYDSAWKQGNIEGLMVCFTNDAILISPRGDKAFGAEQIRKLFSDFLSLEAKATKHTSHITRITFVTDDVAVVDGEAIIEGAEDLATAVRHHRFIDVLVRKGNSWLISQIRAFAIN